MSEIPVVDLDDSVRFAEVLRDGLCEFGFILVEGHRIDPALIRRVYSHFAGFFAGDETQKLACSGVAGGQRGFTPFGLEHAKDCDAPDLKEFFHIGQDKRPAHGGDSGYAPNVWPVQAGGDDWRELREDSLALFRALETCAARLLEELAESFDLPRGTFARMIDGGNSILRVLHYPPVGDPAMSSSLRAAPHEDINLITLLCEATESGLEIRPPGRNEWLSVEVAPGRIVVDSGDMLSRLTNDLIPATTHRVVNPREGAGVDRYSLPFFAHPRPDCDLSVLSRFVSAERPERHPPISAGGFLEQRLREIGLVP